MFSTGYVKSSFRGLEGYLGTKRIPEKNNIFRNSTPRFVNFERQPGAFEVEVINFTLNTLVEVNVFIDDLTMKTK